LIVCSQSDQWLIHTHIIHDYNIHLRLALELLIACACTLVIQ